MTNPLSHSETPLTQSAAKTVALAPMMDWTHRHFRYFIRLMTRHTLLYTEMITTAALIHGDRDRFLGFDASEHPVALQLGGSDPAQLARCATYAEEYGYDEVNINVGCPSSRVSAGRFGACLMAEPKLVAECMSEMKKAVKIPVTVKTRIGIDEQDDYAFLCDFIETVSSAGCEQFIIHARKAWLNGLSPRENREIPPLRYDVVKQLKKDFPQLTIMINGGIADLNLAAELLQELDGVMIGRPAYQNPYLFAEIDQQLFKKNYPVLSRHEIIQAYLPYCARELARGTPLGALTRHIFALFQGLPGARAWRQYLSEHTHKAGAGIEVIENGLRYLSAETESAT